MRLDQALVARGLVPSRTRAQALIRQGCVSVNGDVAGKPGLKVDPDTDIFLEADAPAYVSRAAAKLIGGLDAFGFDPSGRVCLDLGASTGGFTEVLLERGAGKVYAVDVGTDQLHPCLRRDARVISLEKTHARDLSASLVPDPLELIVCDVSFISIMKALPPALDLAEPRCDLVSLVKPQFELGPDAIGKNGRVLTPPEEQRAFIEDRILSFFATKGWQPRGLTESPILGGEGTTEYLFHAQKTPA